MTQPPRYILIENEHGDEELLRWPPDAEGTYATIKTGKLVKWLLGLLIILLFIGIGLGWLVSNCLWG